MRRWFNTHIARQLIKQFGGVDTYAIITSGGNSLSYQYTDAWVEGGFSADTLRKIADGDQRAEAFRRMVHGTWGRIYTGKIPSGWDVADVVMHGGTFPQWSERYAKGYRFPIRYLGCHPAVHFSVEVFDFSK